MMPVIEREVGLIGLVVVNFASARLVEASLAVIDLAAVPARAIVVDNFSGWSERSFVTGLCRRHGWTLVAPPDNRGFAAGVNLGVARAFDLGCSGVVLLNPDARLETDAAVALRAGLDAEPAVVVAPRLVNSAGVTVFSGSWLDPQTGRIRSWPPVRSTAAAEAGESGRWQFWLTAACLAVSATAWRQVGGFDEGYFLYWEDVDFSHRCRRLGVDLRVRADLVAVHDEGGTQARSSPRAKSNRYYYFNCRNRLRFAARWVDRRRLVRWLLLTPALSWEILLRGGRRQLLSSPLSLLACIGGTVAGVALALVALIHPADADADVGARSPVADVGHRP